MKENLKSLGVSALKASAKALFPIHGYINNFALRSLPSKIKVGYPITFYRIIIYRSTPTKDAKYFKWHT